MGIWPFNKTPLPIGAIRSKKKHWPYDDQVIYGLKQVRKLDSPDDQVRWLKGQMEYLAGKDDKAGLNLCVDVIHQYSMFSNSEEAAKLFHRSTDILDKINAGEPGQFVLNKV